MEQITDPVWHVYSANAATFAEYRKLRENFDNKEEAESFAREMSIKHPLAKITISEPCAPGVIPRS